MRCMLKKASVVCHPESGPQKKIALDTEQDSAPYPFSSYGGSSASGTQPSITTARTPARATWREKRGQDHTGCDSSKQQR